MAWTSSADSKLFFSKNDPQDPRLGEWVTALNLSSAEDLQKIQEPSWVLLGYPDDEGIAMNGGRPGAKEAPAMIRTYFYKMTPSLLKPSKKSFFDVGNIPISLPLPQRHERGRELVRAALDAGHKTLSLGGGHDYGYADGAGFIDHCLSKKLRPVLINFDAHLDVRPTDKGFHSGTPFHRLLTQYKDQFDFLEVGLQNQCNSSEHLQWARKMGAEILLLQDLLEIGLKESLSAALKAFQGRPCFLSIDIDAFTSSEAPGCSQSWATGLKIENFLPALKLIQEELKVLGLGIYEVSPPLDQDHRTSKLAALILHHAVFQS